MTIENLQGIIKQAVLDLEYRELLFTDPDKALEGVDLNDEEINLLKTMEREKFDKNATELEDRMSRAGIGMSLRDPGGGDPPKWDPGEWDPNEWDPSDLGSLSKLIGGK